MGQRLNLEIRKKGKPLANAYYHWSAYTGSSYALVEQACMYIQDHASMPAKLLAKNLKIVLTGTKVSSLYLQKVCRVLEIGQKRMPI